jgi:hypothetical protein
MPISQKGNVAQLVEPPSMLGWKERGSIPRVSRDFFFASKEKKDENFEYKNKELFYSIKKKKLKMNIKTLPFFLPVCSLQYLPGNRKTHLYVNSSFSLFYSQP